MASPTIEAIKKQVEENSGIYAARFAGKSRVTRNVAEMDSLIERAKDAVARIEALPKSARDAEVDTLAESARDSLEMFKKERVEIVAAKQGGPDIEQFSRLGTMANFVFARYRRNFGGKARSTRDLGLLAEMVSDLERLQTRMKEVALRSKQQGFKEDIEVVASNIKLYTGERGEIVDARAAGTPDEQADVLAEVANGQFQLYTDHFADKSRLTRRPELLQRMIDNLKQVKDRMVGLRKGGLKSEQNDKNVEIVDANLQMYINELAEIRKARKATKIADLMMNLGGAANDVMEQYEKEFAGKDRKGRDLDLLSVLCDQMGEIVRQMTDLGRIEQNEVNDRNLSICIDNLVMIEAEYVEIENAKSGKSPATT